MPVGAVIFHLEAASAAAPAAAAPAAAAPAAATPAAAASTGGALIEFKLPDVGEGIAEGEIVQWLVADGDAVEEHQPIVEVMTDKATVEVPAPASGTITKLLAEAGDVVPVGDVIFHLSTGASAPVAAPAAAPAAPVGAPVAAAPVRAAGEKILAVPSARRVARAQRRGGRVVRVAQHRGGGLALAHLDQLQHDLLDDVAQRLRGGLRCGGLGGCVAGAVGHFAVVGRGCAAIWRRVGGGVGGGLGDAWRPIRK